MGQQQPLPFTTGFYVDASLPLSAQECINQYPDFPQADTVTDGALKETPGKNLLISVSDIDTTRGAITMAGIRYQVIGRTLYSVDRILDAFGNESFSTTSLGTVEGTGLVSMAKSGEQLVVNVPDGKAYVYDTTGPTFSEITDGVFLGNGPYDTVEYTLGFFTFTQSSGKAFINSPLNDATGPYNALDIATAESDPDNIRAQVNFRDTLYILGSETTQAFQNKGLENAPFVNISGFVLPKGISARFGIVKSNNTFVMIGAGRDESPAVWAFTGNNYQKISTTAIDNALKDLSAEQLDVVSAWAYGEAGAYFVGFNLPTRTFVYDFTAQRWHTRSSLFNGADLPDRMIGVSTAYGRIMIGDAIDGRVGELRLDLPTEYGGNIRRINTTKAFDGNGREVRVLAIEAVMETGVGNAAVPDPVIGMSYSDNGGRTYNNPRLRSMGKIGEYFRRAIWRRAGRFPRSRILRFERSDAVKSTFIKLEADIA